MLVPQSVQLPNSRQRCRHEPLAGDRQAKGKNRTVAQLTRHADSSAVSFDDSFDDRESHSGPLNTVALALPAIELVEDQGSLQVIDAATTIGNADDDTIALDLGAHENRRAGLRILHRVFQQVPK